MEDLAVEIFHDLLVEEYSRTGEFPEINRLTVDTLDTLAHESQQAAYVFLKVSIVEILFLSSDRLSRN